MGIEAKKDQALERPHFENERALVTGGGGFIGSAVVLALLREGATVTVLDDWSSGDRRRLPADGPLTILTGSILNPAQVADAMADCTVVVHEAASSIDIALRDPVLDCDVNVRGTLNVLNAARKSRSVRRVVYASTDAVYGNPRYLPINEDDLLNPLSPFAVSKLAGENYCKAYYETFGLSTTVLRYANVYGAPVRDSRLPAGAADRFLKSALEGRPLQVHGDGEQTRDFVFIDDAVDATLQASFLSKAEGQIYNVGTGIETTINTLVEKVLSAAGSSSPIETMDRLDIDNIRRRVLNIEKIRREIRWTPRITLEQGLRLLIEGRAG
ncbi:NAD-dependent epimerase/dehydratase family protein [bacterium]|nr:NAD-dependent epimerase/dehydratase family protein [bacterium]